LHKNVIYGVFTGGGRGTFCLLPASFACFVIYVINLTAKQLKVVRLII